MLFSCRRGSSVSSFKVWVSLPLITALNYGYLLMLPFILSAMTASVNLKP